MMNLQKIAHTASQNNENQTTQPKNTGKHQTKLVKSQLKETSLTKQMVRELNAQLGQDARDCLEYIKTLEIIYSTHIIEAYKDLHSKYETLPALFLSVTPEHTVYLWQINKLCPYKKENDLALDASSLSLKTCPHLSFLLLAKIKSDEQEKIEDANLIGDSALYTKIKGADNEQIFRFYNIDAFRNKARINPFAQEMLSNNYYSHKIVIKTYKNEADQTLHNLDISLWKKESADMENLLSQETLEGIPTLFNGGDFDVHFNDGHRTSTGVTVLLGKYPATIIAFKDDKLAAVMDKKTKLGSMVNKTKTDLIFYDQDGKIREVGLVNFPNINIEKISENLKKSQQFKISEWQHHEHKCKKTLNTLLKHYSSADTQDGLFVYKVSVSLINPYLIKNDNTYEDGMEEKKEEKDIIEKVDKMKAEFKNAKNEQNSMQDKKELLKEIRANISSKIVEGRKFDKEYQKEQERIKNTFHPIIKEINPPEGVSKETLELYSEIKTEKKRLAKEREKQKGDKIKRSEKNEY